MSEFCRESGWEEVRLADLGARSGRGDGTVMLLSADPGELDMSALLLTTFSRLGRLVDPLLRSAGAGVDAAGADGVAPRLSMLMPRLPVPNEEPNPWPMPILLNVYALKRFDALRSSASRDLSARREGSDAASRPSIERGELASIVGKGDRLLLLPLLVLPLLRVEPAPTLSICE